jgi:hypothetical protein
LHKHSCSCGWPALKFELGGRLKNAWFDAAVEELGGLSQATPTVRTDAQWDRTTKVQLDTTRVYVMIPKQLQDSGIREHAAGWFATSYSQVNLFPAKS